MQNGADQNITHLVGIKTRIRLKSEATEAWRKLVHDLPDPRKAHMQVENPFQPAWYASAW